MDFEERMKEIYQELLALQAESNNLMNTISQNICYRRSYERAADTMLL